MREINREQVIERLKALGIQAGDGLLCHSAIQFLGRPVGGVGMYLQAIQAVIGPQGTLAAPTFNFGFARGEPYDPQETPSQGMGAFSEYVRQRPEALRTPHPMQSLAVIGRYARDLTERDTLSAFDPGSAFERMLELDFKLLLLGADVSATSVYHISEQRNQVPYRYWKDFSGQVRGRNGWQERTYRMFVRDLDLDPITTAVPVQELLQARGQWRSLALNYGKVAACHCLDFVAAVDHFLVEDPWSLVVNRP
ncbi:MAG: AAC(3) family N-acetyltransferase [Anaerolineales bacterium]|nr:AAC(3) family N-acetyltransferase [Anaerolineales bacterium]